MQNLKNFFILLGSLLIVMAGRQAVADSTEQVVQLQSQKTAVATLQSMATTDDVHQVVQKSMHAFVGRAVQALRENQHADLADQYEQDWAAQAPLFFAQIAPQSSGDPQPLAKWLTEFYSVLQATLSPAICAYFRLDDIQTFNDTVPVVLHPDGYRGQTWNEEEYRKYFVPLAGVLVYWTTDAACRTSFAGILGYFLCEGAATVVSDASMWTLAPLLSDEIYKGSHLALGRLN